ncbi:MAG: hypothetical protein HZA50_11815 [Planctomycetes bacterium]|nr:hypothetical protein [Planctomycetota bacterium]
MARKQKFNPETEAVLEGLRRIEATVKIASKEIRCAMLMWALEGKCNKRKNSDGSRNRNYKCKGCAFNVTAADRRY